MIKAPAPLMPNIGLTITDGVNSMSCKQRTSIEHFNQVQAKRHSKNKYAAKYH